MIGISSHASNVGLTERNNLDDICVICGGTIPKHQMQELKKKGVSEFSSPKHFRIHCQIYCFKVLRTPCFRFGLYLTLLSSRISPKKRSASSPGRVRKNLTSSLTYWELVQKPF